jgi:hypothetical protein
VQISVHFHCRFEQRVNLSLSVNRGQLIGGPLDMSNMNEFHSAMYHEKL